MNRSETNRSNVYNQPETNQSETNRSSVHTTNQKPTNRPLSHERDLLIGDKLNTKKAVCRFRMFERLCL